MPVLSHSPAPPPTIKAQCKAGQCETSIPTQCKATVLPFQSFQSLGLASCRVEVLPVIRKAWQKLSTFSK